MRIFHFHAFFVFFISGKQICFHPVIPITSLDDFVAIISYCRPPLMVRTSAIRRCVILNMALQTLRQIFCLQLLIVLLPHFLPCHAESISCSAWPIPVCRAAGLYESGCLPSFYACVAVSRKVHPPLIPGRTPCYSVTPIRYSFTSSSSRAGREKARTPRRA